MIGTRTTARFRRLLRQGLGCLLVLALVVAAGCSEDAPPGDNASLKGKTPVVRPEDVQARGGGGAVALAPDYRQGMTVTLDPALENAARSRPAAVRPASGPAGAGRFCPATVQAPAVSPPASAAVAAKAPSAPQASTGTAASPRSAVAAPDAPLGRSLQMVVVTAPDWKASRGTVRLFERSDAGASWREVGTPAGCALGRHGLGAGRGLAAPFTDAPVKRQGDGRSPAGVFSLPEAFGYATPEAAREAGVRLPYAFVTDRAACVTDPASKLFGQVVGPEERQSADVARQERMLRPDNANLWGVVIGHNLTDPLEGAGSCVFVNVRPVGGPPTGGSIGCPETLAAKLVSWLDPAASPVLVVLPAGEYRRLQGGWGLP